MVPKKLLRRRRAHRTVDATRLGPLGVAGLATPPDGLPPVVAPGDLLRPPIPASVGPTAPTSVAPTAPTPIEVGPGRPGRSKVPSASPAAAYLGTGGRREPVTATPHEAVTARTIACHLIEALAAATAAVIALEALAKVEALEVVLEGLQAIVLVTDLPDRKGATGRGLIAADVVVAPAPWREAHPRQLGPPLGQEEAPKSLRVGPA